MFTSAELEKYAAVMYWGLCTARKKKFAKYENVLLRYDAPARPLAEAVYRLMLKERLNVIARCGAGMSIERDFYEFGDNRQVSFINAGEKELMGSLNGYMVLLAPESLTHLKGVDSRKIGAAAVARKPIRDIMDKREAAGKFSWTLCSYPTQACAESAGLSLNAYAGQIRKACFLGEKNPVAKWNEIARRSAEIKKWLNALKAERIHLESDGCDLEIVMGEKRQFLGGSGHNIPSFEIFTSPDWRGARGTYFCDLPSYRSGNRVSGIKLEFQNGKVVKASAKEGQDFLRSILAIDLGARGIGEFSLTDRRFSRIDKFMANTLFDENFGGRYGNSHIAVGAAYLDAFAGKVSSVTPAKRKALGFNESSVHWDLVNTQNKRVTFALKGGKTVTVYEGGEFKY